MKLKLQIFILASIFFGMNAFAQDQESVLEDINGDGIVSYLGFGDSITLGVGDTEFPLGYGYVGRLAELLGILVSNKGVAGEELVASGQFRFPDVVSSSNSDLVSVMEGSNDAIKRIDSGAMRTAYQRIINVSRALGKKTLLMTLPAGCCDHAASAPFTDSYSLVSIDLAGVNDLRTVDYQKAWQTTCKDPTECELYNVPEGLHPNGKGYEVMAQTLAASILGIDIFAADGAANLESALGLEPGTVIVKPSVEAVSTPQATPISNSGE